MLERLLGLMDVCMGYLLRVPIASSNMIQSITLLNLLERKLKVIFNVIVMVLWEEMYVCMSLL